METVFSEVQFSFSNGKLAPSAHIAVQVTDEGGRQKWRCCLTLNDNGTWQWSPGCPGWLTVPAEVLAAIDASVSARVAQYGIEHAEAD